MAPKPNANTANNATATAGTKKGIARGPITLEEAKQRPLQAWGGAPIAPSVWSVETDDNGNVKTFKKSDDSIGGVLIKSDVGKTKFYSNFLDSVSNSEKDQFFTGKDDSLYFEGLEFGIKDNKLVF